MVHTLFGGSGSDSAVGWAALTRQSIACGAPNFYGGLKVLASLQVILGQFLHEEARGWFPGPPSACRHLMTFLWEWPILTWVMSLHLFTHIYI